MCYLYPQVYDDGCAVREGATIVTPCPAHSSTFRETKTPCDRGKVIISTCGPCPVHGEPLNPAGAGEAPAPAPGSPQHSDALRNPDKPDSSEGSAPSGSGPATSTSTSTSMGWPKTRFSRLPRSQLGKRVEVDESLRGTEAGKALVWPRGENGHLSRSSSLAERNRAGQM